MESQQEVLVIGAGPTGLTAAIELKRFGVSCRVIDKSLKGAQYSQALVIQARTLEQLERYGIAKIAVEQGRKIRQSSIYSEGKKIISFSLDQIPGSYPFVLFYPQNETERLLTDHLHSLGGAVERGVELAGVSDAGDQVSARLRHQDGRFEDVTAQWLIACDGAHSKVRESLQIPFSGSAVQLHFYLGDLEMEGPDALSDGLCVYLQRGNVVFIGRLTDKLYRVIVALHSAQESGGEDKTLTLDDFQEPLDRAGVKLTVKSAAWMTPFRVNDRQAARMRLSRVFLAGDASHIHSPVGGQGMNTGMQDIANLVWKIAAVRDGADDKILDSYAEERAPVGKALLQRTSLALKGATISNPLVEKLRDAVMSIGSKIPQVQEELIGFISETGIQYRGSSIVIDCGGGGALRAGDRMLNPWVTRNGSREPLLKPLENSRHLAIAFNVSDEALLQKQLPRVEFMSLQGESLPSDEGKEMHRLFGTGERVLVIRPDGYIGFRGSAKDRDYLSKYARLTGLV